MTSKTELNFILWTDSIESRVEIIKVLTDQGTVDENKNHILFNYNDIDINLYMRGVNKIVTYPLSGVVDGIIMSLSKPSELAFDYLIDKKNVPSIIVISKSKDQKILDESTKHKAKVYEDFTKSIATELISSSIEREKELRDVFNLIDKEKNGFLSKEDLILLAKQLKHSLIESEANDILKTIGINDKIPYDGFRFWWYTGRSNFIKFRALIELEKKFLPLFVEGVKLANQYGADVESKENDFFQSKINIAPKKEFPSGVSVGLDIVIGKEAQKIIETLPDYHEFNPITFTIELTLEDASKGEEFIEKLNDIKNMIYDFFPLSENILSGGMIKFRQIGLSVYIDITLGGTIGEILLSKSNILKDNSTLQNFGGTGSLYFTSGVNIDSLLEKPLKDLLNEISFFKVEGLGEIRNIKMFIDMTIKLLKTLLDKDSGKGWMLILLSALKLFEIQCEYNSDDLLEAFKDIILLVLKVDSFEEAEGILKEHQQTLLFSIEGSKEMLLTFIMPFFENIKSLSFDKISFFITIAPLQIYYKFCLNLVGLTRLINDKILTE